MNADVTVSHPGQCCDGWCIEDAGVHALDQEAAERIAAFIAARTAEAPAPTDECGAIPPNVGGPIPCHLPAGHDQHLSTSGCAGGEARWTAPADALTLPDPHGGCACHDHPSPLGCPPDVEYEPACPVHSEHVYNPRTGVWDLTHPAPTDAREALARVEALLDERDDLARDYVEGHESRHPGNKAGALVTTAEVRAALSPTAPDAGQREAQEMCSACDATGVKCDETAGCCEVCRATGGCSHEVTSADRSQGLS